ncbi:rhodanese-like domain-containing protein [Azospirillum sp. TSO22-1]|uniref:rhodanese-like domain-containing protein n=1 Tax=Azospirillum sp. TSO22-1 TaxID=716789 RepID=UPI000D618456|nr:rhodanese-like domain-containing protein [Azospirillum sp. TSO22-1]PWC44791.1 sulfurtransferase [Azospirillum sp. TSO22-1]
MIETIDRTALKALLDGRAPVRLAEALPPRYHAEAHLPGAVNLPHDQVAQLAPTLLPDMAAEIVVYCASATCRNSDIAAQHLQRLGYGRVRVYRGGKQDWIDAGLPVETGAAQAA